MTEQHTDLVRFISGIPVTEDGVVYDNGLDDIEVFESTLYTPKLSISALALETLAMIKDEDIKQTRNPIDPDTVTGMIIDSDMRSRGKGEYLIAQIIILESFSLLYNMENKVHNLRFVSVGDITRVKNNISYLSDYLGTVPKYFKMIDKFRDMYVSLGYLEHQIDVIMDDRRVR